MSTDPKDFNDYLKSPEISNIVYIIPEQVVSKKGGDKVYGSINSSSYAFTECAPLISTSHSFSSDKTSSEDVDVFTNDNNVGYVTTITLNGYFINNNPNQGAAPILNKQNSLVNALDNSKYYTVEINNSDGVLLKTYNFCRVISIDFEEGTYVAYGRYTVVLESRISRETTYYHEDYSYNVSIDQAEDYGYMNTSHQNIISSSYLTGTETITVVSNPSVANSATNNANRFIESKIRFNQDKTIYLTGNRLYKSDDSGTSYRIANIQTSTSTNVTTGEVTYTGTFILVPSWAGQQALGQLSLEYNTSSESSLTTISVNGSVKGISIGSYTSTLEMADIAYSAFGQLKTTFYSLASSVAGAGVTLVQSSSTWSETKNFGTGTIDFSVEYNDRPGFTVQNAIYEKIEVSNTPSLRNFSIIPVIGRLSGPVLQDSLSSSEKTRDVSVEVAYKAGYGDASGPGVQAIIDSWEPAANTVYKSADTSTWNSAERRYVRNVSWVYGD